MKEKFDVNWKKLQLKICEEENRKKKLLNAIIGHGSLLTYPYKKTSL